MNPSDLLFNANVEENKMIHPQECCSSLYVIRLTSLVQWARWERNDAFGE